MRVDAAPRGSQIKRVPEEGGTRGLFQVEGWSSKEYAIAAGWGGKGQDEYVRGQDSLLLHARRSNVDLIACGAGDDEPGR
jgi:hypothetical protein